MESCGGFKMGHRIFLSSCVLALLFALLISCRTIAPCNESGAAEITPQEAFERKIDALIDRMITKNMTKEQKCRTVYAFLQKNIDYSPISSQRELISAANDALFITGEGDCYSYFAAAKVIFDHLGIESLAVQREQGYTTDTHFWILVNIGDEGEERWYHFDATVMRQDYAINSCLLTDAQLEAYSRLRSGFYRYDKSKYPTVESEIITENANLDAHIGQ